MYNWREIPLVRILLPFVTGIIIALELDRSIPVIDYLLLLILVPFALLAKRRLGYKFNWIYGLAINLFLLMLGYQLCFYHADLNRKNHFKKWLTTENVIIGKVDNAPSFSSKYVKINLKTEKIEIENDSFEDCQGTVQLSILNNAVSRKLSYGDRLICKVSVKPVKPPLNPLAFDYSQFLHYKNIDYQAFVSNEEWKVLNSLNGNPLLARAYDMRSSFLNILKTRLQGKNEFAVGSALILGFKDELNEDLKTAYANTGAMHVLAVSGLHVGMVWGILAFLLGWIRWRHPAWKWIKTFIILVSLWLFALITGASPSVLRAAAMFSFLIVGTSLGRTVNTYNTLAASAFCLLLYDPFLIKTIGFQLSYLAVIGIVYFQPKVYRLWYIKSKLGNSIWKLTAVAIAAQLTTFPLSLYYFHQFPLYFWLSGLVVVPFAFLILGGGVFLLSVDSIFPIFGKFIGMILNGIIWVMNSLIFLIEQIPSSLLSGIWIGLSTLVLLYIFLFFVSISINTKRMSWLVRAMVFAVLICGIYAFRGMENQVQKEIIFYHMPNKTYAEFIDGEQVVSFGDLDVDAKTLLFATSEYHLSKGIKSTEKYHFGYEDLQQGNWYHSKGFVQFFDKKIAFLKELAPHTENQKLDVDYILIRQNANFELEDLVQRFDFKLIIIDGAMEKFKRFKWKQDCSAQNIPYHDINTMGAFTKTID